MGQTVFICYRVFIFNEFKKYINTMEIKLIHSKHIRCKYLILYSWRSRCQKCIPKFIFCDTTQKIFNFTCTGDEDINIFDNLLQSGHSESIHTRKQREFNYIMTKYYLPINHYRKRYLYMQVESLQHFYIIKEIYIKIKLFN